jgi:hypothetical protein
MDMTPTEDDDQLLIAALLASTPPSRVSEDFLSRVNARIDETAGWLGLADFRVWTLRLAPAAAALALVAILWPGTATTTTPSSSSSSNSSNTAAPAPSFKPASATDWQQDISGDALLDAALHAPARDARAR